MKADTEVLSQAELIEYLTSMRFRIPYIVPVIYSDKLSKDKAKEVRSIISESNHVVGILEPITLKKYGRGQERIDYVKRLTGHDYPMVVTMLSTGRFRLEYEDPIVMEQRAYYKTNPRRAKVIERQTRQKLAKGELSRDEIKMWRLVGILD